MITKLIKLYNSNIQMTRSSGGVSYKVRKEKGKNMPKIISNEYGDFKMPYWETFQDKYSKTYMAVIVSTQTDV